MLISKNRTYLEVLEYAVEWKPDVEIWVIRRVLFKSETLYGTYTKVVLPATT